MAEINVIIAASVGGQLMQETETVIIPPDYDQRDTDALAVRTIEDTAFKLVRREYGRTPTRSALLAATARVRGVRLLLDAAEESDVDTLRERIREIIETENPEAIERWGQDPEGI
jgi:hypothetical protein